MRLTGKVPLSRRWETPAPATRRMRKRPLTAPVTKQRVRNQALV